MTDRVVVSRGPEATRAGLEAWFADQGFDRVIVTVLPGPQATGYSHETVIFDRTCDGETQRMVARVEPQDASVFPDPDLHIEYRLLEAISRDRVPLPDLHAFEHSPEYLGAPFYVMEHLDGQVPPDSPPYPMGGWLYEASPEQRRRVWLSGVDALATPHLVDWTERHLEFVNRSRRLGIEGELEYWGDYIEFCGGLRPCSERAWNYLTSNKPPQAQIALCWGDSRLGNQLFNGERCVALLDWEMACISDPIQDLAWFIHFDDLFSEGLGVARLDGIPSRAETIARYEDLTGFSTAKFDYYEVFAAFRFVLILQRLGNLQVEPGQQAPDSRFATENFATANLEKMLDEKGI